MKSNLKAPGTKRLKPNHEILLSSFAFNFNLRHYNKANAALAKHPDVMEKLRLEAEREGGDPSAAGDQSAAGFPHCVLIVYQCTLPVHTRGILLPGLTLGSRFS